MTINATLWTVGCLSALTDEDLWYVNASDGGIINPDCADYWCFSIKFEPPPLPFQRFVYFEAQNFNLLSVNNNRDTMLHKSITVDITLIMCVGLFVLLFFLTVLSMKFSVL